MKTLRIPRALVPSLLLALALLLPAVALAMTSAPRQPGQEMEASAVAQRSKAHAGDQFAIAVILEYAPTWHSWPNFKPDLPKDLADLTIYPTQIVEVEKHRFPQGFNVSLSWTQWPKPQLSKVAGAKILAFSDRVVAYVPVVIDPKVAPGKFEIKLAVSFQACDEDSCVAPNTLGLTVPIEVVPADQPIVEEKKDLFVNFSQAVFAKILAGEAAAEDWEFDFLGSKFKLRKDAYALILLIAFVAGVLMNFTPCVLPVIPIKILSLQSHAKSPGKLVYLGAIYCLGVVLLYLILGLLAFGLITGGQRFDWGQLFSLPWFTGIVSLIVAALGVAMMGGFAMRLPNFVYMFNPTGDTATGNLIGGLLTGVLATPCTGPLLGAAFAWAVTQPPTMGLLAITTMGVGMAAPYGVLILFPKLLEKMPRGGPGGELLKQVLGIFMLSVAAYLAANLIDGKWPWWIVGGIAMFASLWLIIGAWRMLRSQGAKVLCTVLGLAGIASFYFMSASLADEGPLSWSKFRNKADSAITTAIADAKAKGHVVVVDFTAKWCVNCQFIEKNVLNTDAGVKLLTADKTSLVKVDLTNAEETQGWGVVHGVSGGGGIPLIAVFGPAIDKPVYFQSFFKVSDLEEAIRKARGG